MNKDLFLVYCDEYEYKGTARVIKLDLEQETPGQFKLKANPLYMQILNKSRFIDEKYLIAPSTFTKHIFVWGEENLQEGIDKLISLVESEIVRKQKLLQESQSHLKQLQDMKGEYINGK